uniref:putative reverse transcriptase intron maturase and HNH endonuclease n=1 Tax=Hydrocytium acuminatum TaxID=1745963 RepID=UPI002A825C73|nr:putative reverse transcriptase intron maturase and HNH endonuclease [Hydrocytium acuminatum]WOR09530.1 putative reverse transcriptase intron maturase and HNH endonuclease [Hydrocytium acuminatum]
MHILNQTTSWNTINWTTIQQKVFKWQRKIYTASKENEITKVRYYQHLLLNSIEAKKLAVRRVTQSESEDNKGRKTAGIDGIKSLNPEKRLEMVKTLNFPTKAQPLRRVWIPKPGKIEKRPLGIPTIKDRCLQALFKLALEPEWEARFEPNSYGFRPGRSPHDAIATIQNCIQKRNKYVIDADIAKCFDKINHIALLNKIGFVGKYRKQIQYWLEAGVLDENTFSETTQGTPQGGVISPLLANIALHGLETHLKNCFKDIPVYYTSGNKVRPARAHETLHVIRYADDFVILHDDLQVILRCLEETKKFLAKIGLELSESKTRLTNTLELKQSDTAELGFDYETGFNFLGFTIKQFKTKHRSAKNQERVIGYKTLIYPSNKSIIKHQQKLHEVVLNRGKKIKQEELIKILNPIIRGWASYFGVSNANTTGHLSKQDYLLYLKLRKWARNIKGSASKATSSWQIHKKRKWAFKAGNEVLLSHIDYSIPIGSNGYVKVQFDASPYDKNQIYWAMRLASHPFFTKRIKQLLKSQKGNCKWCNLLFTDEDVMEVDHIIPRSLGGKDIITNLQLLHRHCHDEKSTTDGSNSKTLAKTL